MSVLFVIGLHAYDVGDRISVAEVQNGATMVVNRIDLLSTTMTRTNNGKRIQVANHRLFTCTIENHLRSTEVFFTPKFTCSVTTTFAQLTALREAMVRFAKANRVQWRARCDLVVDDISLQTASISFTLWLFHHGTWQEGRRLWISAGAAIAHANEVMAALGISYKQPVAPVSLEMGRQDSQDLALARLGAGLMGDMHSASGGSPIETEADSGSEGGIVDRAGLRRRRP